MTNNNAANFHDRNVTVEKGYAENVPIAFALVTGAAMATTLGAMMVFCHCIVKRSKHRVLGAALGFSSGVMIYISFLEISAKSLAEFQLCDCLWNTQTKENAAYTAATLCFFLGVLMVFVLDFIVHWFSARGFSFAKQEQEEERHSHTESITESNLHEHPGFGPFVNAGELFDPRKREEQKEEEEEEAGAIADPALAAAGKDHVSDNDKDSIALLQQRLSELMEPASSTGIAAAATAAAAAATSSSSFDEESQTRTQTLEDKWRLIHMGVMTAITFALHNFPEGLATFVAALADPKVGAGLALAIAIHNIPEGLCVAIPIYYATGSRWKAFAIAFLSGITELIGAALGYAFLVATMGPAAYAVLFGLVSGMMVTIALKELLPTAHAYDPKDTLVTKMLVLGMMIMAISLLLFKI